MSNFNVKLLVDTIHVIKTIIFNNDFIQNIKYNT